MGTAGVERGYVEEMGKKAEICRNTDNVRIKLQRSRELPAMAQHLGQSP